MVQRHGRARCRFRERRHVGADLGKRGAAGKIAGLRMKIDAATQAAQRRGEVRRVARIGRVGNLHPRRSPRIRRIERGVEPRALVRISDEHMGRVATIRERSGEVLGDGHRLR